MKKYEINSENRVVALINFGNVKIGDVGGFIGSEKNLSHYGLCWVFGNAQVFGNAWVFGECSKTPVVISGLKYPITIIDSDLRVGCQFHSFNYWKSVKDVQLRAMDGNDAVEFYHSTLKPLMELLKLWAFGTMKGHTNALKL